MPGPVMRWDCDADGCFNQKRRLQFDRFYDLLPGRISFTDVDGMVEINGRFLMLEAKVTGSRRTIPTGQEILYKRFTAALGGSAVYVVWINAEEMAVEGYMEIRGGRMGQFVRGDMEVLRSEIRSWVQSARTATA